jgi:L-threonylcarbamoyladenylate synthase
LKKRPLELLADPGIPGPLSDTVAQAVVCLQQGGIVAFPTETYYGLAVDPYNERALRSLFRIKERDLQKPILVLISEVDKLSSVVEFIPPMFQPLMKNFWPGPLTLIFPAKQDLPLLLTGGTGTIGIRISNHRIAMELCRRWGKPITATSANISGTEPAGNASEVRSIFGSEVEYIIDGGEASAGRCSTVVGIDQGRLRLFREGLVDFASLLQCLDR